MAQSNHQTGSIDALHSNAEAAEAAAETSHHFSMDHDEGQTERRHGSIEPLNATEGSRTEPTWCEYWCSWRSVELALCFVPLILGALTEFLFNPRQRPIPYQYLEGTGEYVVNQVYNETLDGETVPTAMLVWITGWLPLLLQFLMITFCYSKVGKLKRWELVHKTLCVYSAAIGTTILVTNSIKLYVGYLRPIFYDQCQPNEDYTACTADDNAGNTDERQLRLSFPSGHASTSFCGMLLFSKFLEQRFGAYKEYYLQYYSKSHNGPTQYTADAPEAAELGYNQLHQLSVGGSPLLFRFGRIASLLCYSPMIGAIFVGKDRLLNKTALLLFARSSIILLTVCCSCISSG
jgi:hypothetical protein